jgi:hypothetical protein
MRPSLLVCYPLLRIDIPQRRTNKARHWATAPYVGWIRRFIFFNRMRHPDVLGADGINAFLTYLAAERQVSAGTQSQACSALLFLYSKVLGRPLAEVGAIVRTKHPRHLPVV